MHVYTLYSSFNYNCLIYLLTIKNIMILGGNFSLDVITKINGKSYTYINSETNATLWPGNLLVK